MQLPGGCSQSCRPSKRCYYFKVSVKHSLCSQLDEVLSCFRVKWVEITGTMYRLSCALVLVQPFTTTDFDEHTLCIP